jgi:hypothetical protein
MENYNAVHDCHRYKDWAEIGGKLLSVIVGDSENWSYSLMRDNEEILNIDSQCKIYFDQKWSFWKLFDKIFRWIPFPNLS